MGVPGIPLSSKKAVSSLATVARTHSRCGRLKLHRRGVPGADQLGEAVHLSFDEFELGNLAFGLTIRT
jgi:hypothetical protein